MKKYDAYKETGIEWIGEIPNHWEVKKVKYNFSFRTGFTPPSGKEEYYKDGNHIWVNISDMQNKIVSDSANKITDKAIDDFKPLIVPKHSLLYSFKLSVGKVAFNAIDCYTNEAIFSIDPNDSTNLNFFYFSLPEQIIKNANENIYGAKILNQELIKNANLIIPCPAEQTTIANYLDRKTAEIDSLIANKKRLLELYEEEKTAIINQAVTKGINPDAPMKDSGIDWLGEIPQHWEVKRLKYVGKVQTGKTPKIQYSDVDFFENGEIQWFTPSDFDNNNELIESNRKLIQEAIENDEAVLFPEYSIYLVSIGATLGKVSFFRDRASANQQINVVSFFDKVYNPLFGYYFLIGNKEMITLNADYTTLPILNQSKTKDLIMATPPIDEQDRIVDFIEKECIRIDKKKSKTEKLIQLLTEYRTALISEVVTGKIKVID